MKQNVMELKVQYSIQITCVTGLSKITSKVFNTKYSIQITYVTGLSKITSKVGILGGFYPNGARAGREARRIFISAKNIRRCGEEGKRRGK